MAEVVADDDHDTIPHRADDDGSNRSFQVDEEEDRDQYHQRRENDDEDIGPEQDSTEEQQQQHQQRNHTGRPVVLRTESNSSRPREATELGEIVNLPSSSSSTASLSSGEYRVTPRHSNRETRASQSAASTTSSGKVTRYYQAVKRWWGRNIILNVPHKGNRDHFALERTFLAYMRTAATFSMQGVLVAQIFRLQTQTGNAPNTTPLSFFSVGGPLCIAYQTCAICVALMGAYRFWRQQNAIARGKVIVGGWDIHGIGLLTLLAGLTMLALVLAIIAEDA